MKGKRARRNGIMLRIRQFEERDRAELERFYLKSHPDDRITPEPGHADKHVRLVLEDSDQEARLDWLDQQMRIARRLRKPVARGPKVLPPSRSLSKPDVISPAAH